jgi:hypothetical protein
MLALILWLPWMLATEIRESTWTAPPLAITAATIGLHTLMFLALFSRFPRWIRAHYGEEEAKRWKYAALMAGFATGPLTVAFVVPGLLPENHDLGLGLGMLAMVVMVTLFFWLMARHFPEACNWIPLRRR